MTPEELEQEGWEDDRSGLAVVIELEGGGKIYASRDGEGNGPGVLFGVTEEGESVYVAPSE